MRKLLTFGGFMQDSCFLLHKGAKGNLERELGVSLPYLQKNRLALNSAYRDIYISNAVYLPRLQFGRAAVLKSGCE